MLGLPDLDTDDLMAAALTPGLRRMPVPTSPSVEPTATNVFGFDLVQALQRRDQDIATLLDQIFQRYRA